MNGFELDLFLLLAGLGLVCALGVIPLGTHIVSRKLPDIEIPASRAATASALQGGVLAIGAAGGGLVFAHWAGFELPFFRALMSDEAVPSETWGHVGIGLPLGLASALVAVLLEWRVFWNFLPQGLKEGLDAPAWKRATATLYGGVTEEILTRLFFLSLFAWALSFIWEDGLGHADTPAVWIAILLSALIFGLLHLPATILFAPLTRAVVVRTLALNGVVAIAAGWVFVEYGLLAAMATHWAADVVILLVAPGVQARLVRSGWLVDGEVSARAS